MSINGCAHLDNYKSAEGTQTYRIIHKVFVVCATPETRKQKIINGNCHVCRKIGPYLHACLQCVFFGCYKHAREHSKFQKHELSMDLNYGQIYCMHCGDYVYDNDMEKIAEDNKVASGRKKKFVWSSWEPTLSERELLKYHPKRICITPESTIGLRGLLNLGSTCFMNCIIQVLMHTPLLRDYFLMERHQCKGAPGSCLVCELSRLFQEFYKGSRVPLALHELLHLIWTHAKHLAGYEQRDAHEFFISTLDILHRHCRDAMPLPHPPTVQINKINRCPCIIDQIFTGGLQSDLVCQKCNGVSTTIDPIWDFSLDLGPATIGGRPPSSLLDCLERFTRAEHLGPKAKIHCSVCESYQESTKQLSIKTLPVVVSFHLKRFDYGEDSKKISTLISFPETLDMTPFMSKQRRNQKHNPCGVLTPDNRYSLFAVINHVGTSINAGHYTAFVRQQHDYWYKCNDDVINRANLKEVLDSEGYLLFYHKHILEYE